MRKFIGILLVVFLCLLYLPFRITLPYQHREKMLLSIFNFPIFHFLGKTIMKFLFNMTEEELACDDFVRANYPKQPILEKIKRHGSPFRVVYPEKIIQNEFFLIFQQPNDYKEMIK